MKFYGIDMRGPFHAQDLVSLPTWQASDERRLVKVDDDYFLGTSSEWIKIFPDKAIVDETTGNFVGSLTTLYDARYASITGEPVALGRLDRDRIIGLNVTWTTNNSLTVTEGACYARTATGGRSLATSGSTLVKLFSNGGGETGGLGTSVGSGWDAGSNQNGLPAKRIVGGPGSNTPTAKLEYVAIDTSRGQNINGQRTIKVVAGTPSIFNTNLTDDTQPDLFKVGDIISVLNPANIGSSTGQGRQIVEVIDANTAIIESAFSPAPNFNTYSIYKNGYAKNASYHIFLIMTDSGTIDIGFDTDPVATNLRNDALGYPYYRRIWTVATESTGVEPYNKIQRFYQNGNVCELTVPMVFTPGYAPVPVKYRVPIPMHYVTMIPKTYLITNYYNPGDAG